MKAVTKIIFLDDRQEKFFGEGPARLLRSIEEAGSLRAAALSMNMAYTKALKLVRNAEDALGFPLIHRFTGGKDGGGSSLTEEGKEWLDRYEAYRDACLQTNERLYLEFFRLTKDCIWNSFQSSNKRHLILTGSRGSGKTTLLRQLFPETLPGLTTWAQPQKAVFLRENLSGQEAQAGLFDPALPGPGNQMRLLPDGFTSLGIPALLRCMEADSPWITIDEIGYLETRCSAYLEILNALLEKKRVAAVVRKQELPFLKELCSRKDVFLADLDQPFGAIGCVIMASGLGKRFGGNKLMADFHGRPLICRILDATEGIFLQRVVVTRHEDLAQLCKDRGIPTRLHALPHRSDTVRLGLEALEGIDRCMFAASDQPLLRQETIAALALASANVPDAIWRTAWGSVPGSPVVFPEWTFEELLKLPKGQGGGALIKKYPGRLHTVNVRDKYELKDMDTPADLAELLER